MAERVGLLGAVRLAAAVHFPGRVAERVGFEPTCRFYPTIRFRVGAVMTASVPLRAGRWFRGGGILAARRTCVAQTSAERSRQKPRLLPAATAALSEKRPQASFSDGLLESLRAEGSFVRALTVLVL